MLGCWMLMKLCLPHYADHVIGKECFGVWILLNVSSACLDCCIFFFLNFVFIDAEIFIMISCFIPVLNFHPLIRPSALA